jgi:hypothetical protein
MCIDVFEILEVEFFTFLLWSMGANKFALPVWWFALPKRWFAILESGTCSRNIVCVFFWCKQVCTSERVVCTSEEVVCICGDSCFAILESGTCSRGFAGVSFGANKFALPRGWFALPRGWFTLPMWWFALAGVIVVLLLFYFHCYIMIYSKDR